MSNFTSNSSFKNFNRKDNIPITTKKSQKEIKKQKKLEKQNGKQNNNISDKEFELLMQSDNDNILSAEKYNIPKFTESNEIITKIFELNLYGSQLVEYINNNYIDISGLELLNKILLIHTDPTNVNWINQNKYGEILHFLFDNNIKEQVIALLMIQDYCKQHKFMKITIKNNEVYLIRIMFQLFFTSNIIDESSYYKWLEYLDQFDNDTKNLLLIQTNEFFMILKTVFNDDDEEENNNDEQIQTNKSTLKVSNKSESDSDSEPSDKEEKKRIEEYNGNNNYNYTGNDDDFSFDDI